MTSYKRKQFEKTVKKRNPVAKELAKKEFLPKVVETKKRQRNKVTVTDVYKFLMEEKDEL